MNHAWTRYLPGLVRDKLAGRPALQQAISSTGWLLLDNLVRMGAGFFINAWIIRYLGPDRFGTLSFAIALVALLAPVAQLGLDAVVVRDMVAQPERRAEILGSAFVLKLAGGALSMALTLTAILALRPADRTSQALVGIIILGTLLQSVGVIDFWFQAQVQSRYSSMARIAACLIIYGVKAGLILTHAPLLAFAWAGVAELAISSTLLVLMYRATGGRIGSWQPTRKLAARLLRDGWLLMASDLVFFLYLRVDRIMLGEMSGTVELGIYSVAAMAAEALFFLPIAVSLSLFPAVVQAKAEGEELFQARLQQYFRLMVFLGYAVAIPVTGLAGWLIPLLFGSAYERAAGMLVGLSWAGIFINLILARSYYLTAMNWGSLHLAVDGIGCLTNVALNCFLIPRYGGPGAVAASIVSYGITAYALCFLSSRLRPTGIMMTRALMSPKFW